MMDLACYGCKAGTDSDEQNLPLLFMEPDISLSTDIGKLEASGAPLTCAKASSAMLCFEISQKNE